MGPRKGVGMYTRISNKRSELDVWASQEMVHIRLDPVNYSKIERKHDDRLSERSEGGVRGRESGCRSNGWWVEGVRWGCYITTQPPLLYPDPLALVLKDTRAAS